jgi:hypothetical protein
MMAKHVDRPQQPKDFYPFAVQRFGTAGMMLYDIVFTELTQRTEDPWQPDVARDWIDANWSNLVASFIPPEQRVI